MPRKYVNKGLRLTYEKNEMIEATDAVQKGLTLRAAAQRYGVPFGTLCKFYKKSNDVSSLGGGRKPELSATDEQDLAKYLLVCALHGEGLTRSETLQLVKDFVQTENIKTRWENDKGPGIDWFRGFLNRHPELRIRKGEALSSQRVRGTDPFIIKKFYSDIQKMYEQEKITSDDGGLIFNCDETAFSHDPKDVRVVAAKGVKRVSKNIAGSGKTNTTVLACGAADGKKLPPFIIFTGKQMWSSWIPEKEYEGTCYAVQENGWMDGNLFFKWFKDLFLKSIPPSTDRQKKVILFFDGVIFHISYALVKLAQDNNVVLVKFPPNVSHFIQPLDKTVFKTMKTDWKVLLLEYNRKNPGKNLTKAEFVEKIGVLWEESFKPRNIKSGFQSTGLFPVDFTRFPETSFDPVKLERFKSASTQSKTAPVTPTTSNKLQNESNPGSSKTVNPSPLISSQVKECIVSEEVIAPPEPVAGPSTRLTEAEKASEAFGTESPKKSNFELFIRKKLSETVSEVSKQSSQGVKRKKIPQGAGEILTKKSVEKRLLKEEMKKKIKKEKVEIKTAKTAKVVKKNLFQGKKKQEKYESGSSEDEDDLDVNLLLSDNESDQFEMTDYQRYLQDMTDGDDVSKYSLQELEVERYFAVFYDIQWYIGRVTDIKESTCVVKFLKQDLEQFTWPNHDDIQEVQKEFIFYGPLTLIGNGPFTLKRSDLVKIKALFQNKKREIRLSK